MRQGSQILWASSEAAIVTGGANTADWLATGICVRAQDIRPGDLFIASEGESLDMALSKGAVAAVVSHVPDDHKYDIPLLKVASTFDALRDLARTARFRSHASVFAVQGRQARQVLGQTFAGLGSTHEGGKMLSLSMANLPEDYEFGIFGLAPSVCPDVAIISDPVSGVRDGLFENMPKGAAVIINRDCDDFMHVVARAKAAGIEDILSFGHHIEADARIVEALTAENGTRLSVSILGDDISFNLSQDAPDIMMVTASLLATKMVGKNMRHAARVWQNDFGGIAASLAGGLFGHDLGAKSLSLFEALPGVKRNAADQAVFRVKNMIDLGRGRQTALLDHLSFPQEPATSMQSCDLAIPHRSANLDFVYTSKKIAPVSNAHALIKNVHASATLEQIVPEVLAPGDYLVFKQTKRSKVAIISEAIRMKSSRKEGRKQNAL